jgi:hypothetical protein
LDTQRNRQVSTEKHFSKGANDDDGGDGENFALLLSKLIFL